jgi:parallel beta-helix repeat protein
MKERKLLFLLAGIFGWYSCSKTEIKPLQPSMTVSAHVRSVAVNLTSYVTSSPINLNGSHDTTISGKSINGGTVPAISLSNCYNVTITQNSLGNSTDVGIYLYNCYNITIEYNYITNVSTGVYVDHSTGGGMIVNYNQFLNMNGPGPRGQFVQFNTVSGANNSISYNKGQNVSGQSNPQEDINLYMSNGTPASPIQVNGNWILGGGPASAGGGIQLGDTGGSYETASNNILVNPGQMGMSISGGDNISMTNNTIFAVAQPFTNVGIVVWGQAGYSVTNSTVSGNNVNYLNAQNVQNDDYIGPGTATPAGWSTNVWGANITAAILPAAIISTTAATVPIPIPITVGTTTTTTTATTTATSPTSSAPINLTGQNSVTISNLSINGGSVPCITLTNCTNVYITLCTLENSTDAGIKLTNCTNVTIEKNNIAQVAAGVVAANCPNGGINVFTNQMLNMQGPAYEGAFVQYTNVGGTNNNISYNKLENIMGQSSPLYGIDIAQSNGTAASPIYVYDNWILGGGPNASGGGIQLGDNGGSYQVASNNILVNPGQFGMSIAGGDNISITNNSIYAGANSFTNVGIFVWGEAGYTVTNSTVSGNLVNFTNAQNVENDSWLGSGTTTPAGWSTNTWGANITATILPASIVSI